MNENEKLSVDIGRLTVLQLMNIAEVDPEEALRQVNDLSPEACKRFLFPAVNIGGLLLRWDAKAAERGGAVSVREVLAAVANGISDELGNAIAPPTLQ